MVQKKSKKVLIICSDFYKEISDNLLKGSETYLKDQNDYSGFIVLGCIIKGETDHYQIVKDICYQNIYSIAYKNCIPLGSAILTVNNYEQAKERSLPDKKNLGQRAAIVCCDLMNKV